MILLRRAVIIDEKVAKTLHVSMEELLEECFKGDGDIPNLYWERKWYRESFYLLTMVDYLSRENGLPLCNDYEDIRNCTLPEPLYPRDVILATKMNDSLDRREQCLKEAIPEFLRFNIVESEIRNVC